MHNLINKEKENSFEFVVTKRQVNKHKTLQTSILFRKVESSAKMTVTPYSTILNESPNTFELDFIENAYLNDELIVKNRIQKLNSASLELCVTVWKKKSPQKDMICKAVFGYTFKKAS